MTPAAALALMLERTREAMERSRPALCACGHYNCEICLWVGGYSRALCDSRGIGFRHQPVSELLSDVHDIITARRQSCYGALQITDAQVDELARAVTQRFELER